MAVGWPGRTAVQGWSLGYCGAFSGGSCAGTVPLASSPAHLIFYGVKALSRTKGWVILAIVLIEICEGTFKLKVGDKVLIAIIVLIQLLIA